MTINIYASFCCCCSKIKLKRHFRLLPKIVKSILKTRKKIVKEQSLEWLHDEFCGFTLPTFTLRTE